ncbi:putative Methyltransferase type 12 [Paraburkholderia ribeironis]|uniref:Putative Methyltransferase type 12 n=1 Tax=Paraburkholderia ribeironis TaxID=1247936 RepID=A0A1N7SP87_9BURK|nr:class I SAM-dependent methyltransferase [Paraburkholderia ribeironis]SIT49233.1 putative Methyltransferase type 12 [Paraburkholderia ribeironis]
MTNEAAQQFDQLASLYEDMFTWSFRKHFEVPTALRVAGDVRNLTIMDFGCGGGGYTRLLKKGGAKQVVGYEPTPGMRDYALKQARQNGLLDVSYISDLSALPRDLAGKFDLLLSIYVLPYATGKEKLDAMCAEKASLIRPGGRFVAVTINPDLHPDSQYYKRYGLSFSPDDPKKESYGDGSRLRLELDYHGYTGSVHAWYWKHHSVEQALEQANIHSICWHRLEMQPNHRKRRNVPDDLRPYQDQPHAIVIEGVRG